MEGEKRASADPCCHPEGGEGHGTCPPGPDCPCCPQLRPALPVLEVAYVIPSEDQVPLIRTPAAFRPSPHPREILHVPKADRPIV
jgi:hypothetical protein